uniref:Uncharacterized protein n=2 Tax=Avena sativa TaxID=4498 RepID=A0ACD5W689_AVESA
MERGGGGVRFGDGTGGTDCGGGGSSTRKTDQIGTVSPLPTPPREIKNWGDGDDSVQEIRLLDESKHRDGSICSDSLAWHKMYRTNLTEETCLEPMMMSTPTNCWPNMRDCKGHLYCHMMQIYSLKLAHISADTSGRPIQLYGFMAARDLLNPRRNYVFNRPRDDPSVVVQDGDDQFIRMPGPKRGIEMQASVLVEFDMRIKVGENEEDDLQLIDGAVCFSYLGSTPGRIYTRRIVGDCGAVDISLVLLHRAAEATIQVGISDVRDSGLSLFVGACANRITKELWLFDGVVTEPCDLNNFVVAAVRGTKLILRVKFGRNGDSHRTTQFVLYNVRRHGSDTMIFRLDYATIQLKVTWSTLDVPNSALGADNHYKWAEYESVEYDFELEEPEGTI